MDHGAHDVTYLSRLGCNAQDYILEEILAILTTCFFGFCKFDYIFFAKREILTTFCSKSDYIFNFRKRQNCKKNFKIFWPCQTNSAVLYYETVQSV